MGRLRWARWFAWIATTLVIGSVGCAYFFADVAMQIVRDNEQIFKLIGLGLGPFLAVLGFVWGVVDKIELKYLAAELGGERAKAAAASAMASDAQAEVTRKVARIEALERDLAMVADGGQMWKLRDNAPFAEYEGWKFDPRGARVVTIGLFKGGVGKTHLAANFAAYVSEKQQKAVLLIDLDFQGSLSTAVLRSAGVEEMPESRVDTLFAEDANLATVIKNRVHLATRGPSTVLNDGNGLARAWIVPADYTLAQTESQMLVKRVLHNAEGLDERYRLAHVLLHPEVRREFSLIIIDTPPRMTIGTVNALVASHNYIVPVIPDRVSSEAVLPFLVQIGEMSKALKLSLEPAGIVATLTRQMGALLPREEGHWQRIRETAVNVLGVGEEVCIATHLPDKVAIRDGGDLAYFLRDNNGPLRSQIYDPLFDELWTRIMKAGESK